MSAVTRPKGPLPARVYWFRRTMVLTVAVLLVFTVGKVLTGGSDGADPDAGASAQLASDVTTPAAEESTDPPADEGTDEATPDAGEQDDESAEPQPTKAEQKAARKAANQRAKQAAKAARKSARVAAKAAKEAALPEPTGTCRDDDIMVTPVIVKSAAGSKVEINLELTTREAPACTWSASRESLVVNITSGSDDIWTTRHCPGGLNKPTAVTVRKQTPAVVPMHWSGRRSDADCSKLTQWAMPGYYHVHAAALTGEPSSVQFQLGKAQPATVTKTVKPKAKNKKKRNRQGSQPTDEPIPDAPNGAVEPNG